MTISKTQQVISLLQAGEVLPALRISKSFRFGITPEQKKVLNLGYECLIHPYIYRQLGKDPETCINAAVLLLRSIYADRL